MATSYEGDSIKIKGKCSNAARNFTSILSPSFISACRDYVLKIMFAYLLSFCSFCLVRRIVYQIWICCLLLLYLWYWLPAIVPSIERSLYHVSHFIFFSNMRVFSSVPRFHSSCFQSSSCNIIIRCGLASICHHRCPEMMAALSVVLKILSHNSHRLLSFVCV